MRLAIKISLLALVIVLLSTSSATSFAAELSVEKSAFGNLPDGSKVDQYTLSNSHNTQVKLITFGAHVTSVEVHDRNGQRENVTLGFKTLDEYLAHTAHFGCTVGRFANRIARGRFTLDDKTYQLAKNNGENHLHGGNRSFDQVLWKAKAVRTNEMVGVQFDYLSPDGDENYPGNLAVTVVYSLNEKNELAVDYKATTDKPTILNLTNHCYWNLTGDPAKKILDHELMVAADGYLRVNSEVIPTGHIDSVKETPMDFNRSTQIGLRFPTLIKQGLKGYGYCYVLRPSREELPLAARLYDPFSGRVMEILTTQPGLQFYTGNFLDSDPKNGGFGQHSALCLETEHFPDSPNHLQFPSTELRPGQTYHERTVHRFSVAK
jgi:aldose 1-epimerase